MHTYALKVQGVSKRFGPKLAVDNLSFSVPSGSILALLGPNGAGKTTTIEMCEGFQPPDSGHIEVLGLNPATQPDAVRARVGIMLQAGGSYSGIRTGEALKLAAAYSSNPLDPDWLLELLGLSNVRNTTYRRLSGGQQQRLSLALALVGRPELVFLDEPTAGMDAQSRLMVWKLMNQLREDGVTVVLTTHLMDEAEALADHVVIVDRGQVVAEGTTEELRALFSKHAHATFATSAPLPPSVLHDQGITQTRPLQYKVQGESTPAALAALATACERHGILITEWSTQTSSLEDVFLSITGSELRS